MDKSGTKKSLAILGGTFNPVHKGHLTIASASIEQLKLDKVIFVPARIPPHKEQQDITEAKIRYQMTELAIADNPCYEISSYELEKETVSYSVQTIAALRCLYPEFKIYFVIGSDTVPELAAWYNIDKIFRICTFIIAKRPGYESIESNLLPDDAVVLEGIYPDISSTRIRAAVKQGSLIKNFVPEKVADFIIEHKLYI